MIRNYPLKEHVWLLLLLLLLLLLTRACLAKPEDVVGRYIGVCS